MAGFRLGEEPVSDPDESDDSQSATSERSLSSPKPDGKRTKSKKKRERKQMGALTDEIDTLLGAAFSATKAHAPVNAGTLSNY